ncbi:Rpn family recombination-promoting nuclease/putative transposase [Coleofasciculus sp. E1-EBD-02]|uniref:Rpn family recombination-promoting nuclease/putative transposase n=1 Tax=Coleofasciculus sp. E1-EBD-02 TaxID=3068481 RepID=UPI00330011F3
MRFISPKIDYAFKKIFGSEQSQEILISFLNAIIYNEEKIIQSLTIVNPYNPDQVMTLKETYLDVKAVLADGSIVVIEMQIAPMTAFNKRVAYNLTKAYSNQLKTGDDYPLPNPAIAVTITDFTLFANTDQVINQFVFQEKTQKIELLDGELKLIFVELPKFNKTLSELQSLTDKWIYFLKEAASLESVPDNLGEVSEIELALNLANQATMTVEELEVVDRRGIMLQDEKGRLAYAEEKGKEKGKEEGKEEGRLQQTKTLVGRLILKRFGEIPLAISRKIEELPLSDLERLAEEIFDFQSLPDLASWLEDRQ